MQSRQYATPVLADEPVKKPKDQGWFLGYDGSCSTCASMAQDIDGLAGDKIRLVNLRAANVAEWRRQALSPTASWAPTLFRVRGERVEAWTGHSLIARLAILLGPLRAWKVAELVSEYADTKSNVADASDRFGRRRVIKGLSGIAAGVVLAGGFKSMVAASSPNNPPEYCGVNYVPYPDTLHGGAPVVNCRACPNTSSAVVAQVTDGSAFDALGYTYQGQVIDGSTVWWYTRVSGCWISASATAEH